MLRRPQKNPQIIKKTPATTSSTKQSFIVVFASTIDLATMKKLEQHIIGIYDNLKEADLLEKNFNDANEGEKEGQFTKAYSVRYTVPYLAPMVKRALNM